MREKSKWQGCVENVAMFGIAMLLFIIAFSAAAYMHENAHQWEAPATFISLGMGILPALWYGRVKRHGRVASILAGLFLTFSFTAALFHGWETQAVALVTVALALGSVIVFVGLARATRSLSRHIEASARAAGEELNGDPLFRDDGQRITVYPRQGRLILSCVMQAAILVGIGCVFAFVRTDDLGVWIGLGIFACLLIIFFPVTLYRLVIRRPSLVVGPDGILDSGSFIWSGVGLVHWNEILAVYPATRTSGWLKQHFLDIMVADLPAIRRRLPLLKRLALRNTFSGMSQLLIMQSMLETPVDDLAQQIDQYVGDHAPPRWREDAKADEASASEEK